MSHSCLITYLLSLIFFGLPLPMLEPSVANPHTSALGHPNISSSQARNNSLVSRIFSSIEATHILSRISSYLILISPCMPTHLSQHPHFWEFWLTNTLSLQHSWSNYHFVQLIFRFWWHFLITQDYECKPSFLPPCMNAESDILINLSIPLDHKLKILETSCPLDDKSHASLPYLLHVLCQLTCITSTLSWSCSTWTLSTPRYFSKSLA